MSSFFSRKKAPLSGPGMGEGQAINLTDKQIEDHFNRDLKTALDKTGGYTSMMQFTQILDASETVLLESRSAEPANIERIKDAVQTKFLLENSGKIMGTAPKLQTAMALSLIEELRSVTGKGHDELLPIVREKLALVHKNFSEVIRSMGLEASLNTPEKAHQFILMTPKDFPKSHRLTSINLSNSQRVFTVFMELRGAAPVASAHLFADAAISDKAGAGSASGSSTDTSPSSSKAPGVTG